MVSIIPKPLEINKTKEDFHLTNDVTIISPLPTLKNYLEEILAYDFGISHNSSSKSQINLVIDENMELGEEGYSLTVESNVITISASTEKGIFYGIQTLRQLIYGQDGTYYVDGVNIKDKPRFSWRGFMFDVGRHYHSIETIKKCLDIMALVKMNIFHFSLTQDQGWRIEIKKYPKLTEIGSKRKDTKIGSHLSKAYRGKPHEGFYTQDEIREIVQYAKERHIEVIPEINLPGHTTAAIASYPNLSCTGKHLEVKTKPGIFFDIYCAGKEEVFEFLEGVFDEVIELFPSDIIHIGGDEAPKRRWRACHLCQERIKNENLKNEHELQVYFTNRIGNYLKSKGKRIIGWNEILGGGLDDTTIVQWWIGTQKMMKPHLTPIRKFVMSNFSYTYLDYNYLMHPMRKFYRYEPVPMSREKYEKNILGVETPIWTEWVPNLERLGWQVFPRLFAIAEVAWTEAKLKNYRNFKQRVPNLLKFLDKLEMPYAKLDEVDPSNWERYTHMRKWMMWPEV